MTTTTFLPLTEGVHVFRTHAEMWEWLNHHGFEIEGGYGDDGSLAMTCEPEGWEWETTCEFEWPEATVWREDTELDELPMVRHPGAP